jgi:hypothetical protein
MSYYICLRCLIFKIPVPIKLCKVSNDQNNCNLQLQYVFKGATFHVKADGSVPNVILMNML